MTVLQIKNDVIPFALKAPAIVSRIHIPRFWATVYQSTDLSGLAHSTCRRRLGAIDSFYRFVENQSGRDCLDELLAAPAIDELTWYVEGFFNFLRNESLQDQADRHSTWSETVKFVDYTVNGILDAQGQARSSAIRGHAARQLLRYKNFLPNRKRYPAQVVRAIPSPVLSELYEIFDPNSTKNPFRIEWQRWRNYCLFLILLHQGLRRGEALLLRTDAVKSERSQDSLNTYFWMNIHCDVGEDDPRLSDPPAIKNAQSQRQIPVSPVLANIINIFVDNYRGRSKFPFLFLNNRGGPLNSRGLGDIMERVTNSLSNSAKVSLTAAMHEPRITAHDFRHTCAVARLAKGREIGIPEDEMLQSLRAFFGWSRESQMPRLYARAYWESKMHVVWDEQLDPHVELLRQIEFLRNG